MRRSPDYAKSDVALDAARTRLREAEPAFFHVLHDLEQRQAVAEGLGTAMLLATVVGSGVVAERLAGGNVALALLANTLATGAGLAALLLTFGPISGAHFNPAVTLADASQRGLPWRSVPVRVVSVGGEGPEPAPPTGA